MDTADRDVSGGMRKKTRKEEKKRKSFNRERDLSYAFRTVIEKSQIRKAPKSKKSIYLIIIMFLVKI